MASTNLSNLFRAENKGNKQPFIKYGDKFHGTNCFLVRRVSSVKQLIKTSFIKFYIKVLERLNFRKISLNS